MLPLLLLDLANICSPYSIGLHYCPLSHTVMFYSTSEPFFYIIPTIQACTVVQYQLPGGVLTLTGNIHWGGQETLDEGDLGEEISSRFI